jgi:murein DD-endopeptidase MepM/ murein hydrolase activator NlpD
MRELHPKTPLTPAFLTACLAASLAAAPPEDARSHKSSAVTVTHAKRTNGKGSVLTCRITDCLEATVTLTVDLTNMRALEPLPGTFVAGEGTRSWELVPIDPNKHWHFDYKTHWRGGGMTAHQDLDHVYQLPYPDTEKRHVIQANFGKHSHGPGTGDEYATDWAMPVGSPVCAARGGIVVALRQYSDKQGVGPEFSNFGNYVIIRHEDGTFGKYVHLQKNGALVEIGQRVKVGEVIALSGHTGNSTAPHLHFGVYVNKDGETKTSLPIRWKTRAGAVVDALKQGQWY